MTMQRIGLDGHDGTANVELGLDDSGPYAVLGCDAAGCAAHEALRAAWPPREVDGFEMAAVVMDWALEDGWSISQGGQWCPTHRPE